MKKIAPHISSKRGSMLMLTLIVFMVILILGMTMITSMLYSQGENTMQINEQKAYYAALSAVDSVKAYFLNPKLDSSIASPHELIGGKYTYNLNKDQGIDEDTTVTIEIIDGGDVPNESSKNYIVIEATGTCQGEKSTVTARMIEEEQKGGSAGLYSSHTVLACNRFSRSRTDRGDMEIEGNIFVDNAGMQLTSTIASIDLTVGQGGDLFIRSEGDGLQLQYSKLGDIFFQSKLGQWKTIEISYNKQIGNIYFQELPESVGGVNFNKNIYVGQAQFLMNDESPSIQDNEQIDKLILSVTEAPGSKLNGSKIGEQHIHIRDTKNISETEDLSSYISNCKQYIEGVMKGLDQMSEVLQGELEWDSNTIPDDFIKVESGKGPYIVGAQTQEYYSYDRNIRLVVSNDRGWPTIQENRNYHKLKEDEEEPEQVFLILEEAQGILFTGEPLDTYEAFYIYAPNAYCQFQKDFNYFKGSIIARVIEAQVKGKFIFREPQKIDGIGVPGGTDSAGSSSSTTYTYHFEEYIENDKDQS